MKKGKLAAGLATGFVASLVLCACNTVTGDKNHIVTYKDYETGQVSVDIDSYYDSYRHTQEGINKIYDATLEAIIRYEFQSGKMSGKTEKSLSELKEDASNKVKGKKEDASKNAETNHTSYDVEWNAILKSYNVENESRLYQHFLYELEKEQVDDWYIKESYKMGEGKTLMSEFIGVDKDGKSTIQPNLDPTTAKEYQVTEKAVAPVYPYHIKHVLASISDDAKKFYNNVITKDEAKNLWKIAGGLADKDMDFGTVAFRYSGDEGSKKEYGDAGVMTTTTSFINEFKLGIYAYDAIFSGHAKSSDAIQEGLGVIANVKGRTKSVEDTFKNDIKLASVPLKAFYQISKVSEDEKDEAGLPVNEGNEHYYPRNIFWNNYCNLHQPFVINNAALAAETDNPNFFTNEEKTMFNNLFTGTGNRFKDATEFGLDASLGKVLVDEKGRIIVGARGDYGIHFMVMQKSIYDFKAGGETVKESSLEEYYTPYIPGDANYPHYKEDGETKEKVDTYVHYYDTKDASVYNTRAKAIKDAIKSFDTAYSYRIYEEFVGEQGVTFKFNGKDDCKLSKGIKDMITEKKKNAFEDRKDVLANAWRSYIEKIEVQNANRVAADIDKSTGKAKNKFRLIPEGCAIGFKSKDKGNEWQEGGYCYAKK